MISTSPLRLVSVEMEMKDKKCRKSQIFDSQEPIRVYIFNVGRDSDCVICSPGYVNVCAAVCLVLLVGGLFPHSSAAPHRTMDRQRRSAQQENSLWGNPCDYGSNVSIGIYIGFFTKLIK